MLIILFYFFFCWLVGSKSFNSHEILKRPVYMCWCCCCCCCCWYCWYWHEMPVSSFYYLLRKENNRLFFNLKKKRQIYYFNLYIEFDSLSFCVCFWFFLTQIKLYEEMQLNIVTKTIKIAGICCSFLEKILFKVVFNVLC